MLNIVDNANVMYHHCILLNFKEFKKRKNCVWMEMYSSVDFFAFTLFCPIIIWSVGVVKVGWAGWEWWVAKNLVPPYLSLSLRFLLILISLSLS